MTQLLLPAICVLAFLAVVLAVQGVAGLIFSSRDLAQRTNRRLTMLASGMDRSQVYAALVRRPTPGTGSNIHLLWLYEKFANRCRQAGVEIAPPRLLTYVGMASAALWLVSVLLFRSGNLGGFVLNAIFAVPASMLFCGLLFWIWLDRKRTKRLKLMEEQMPLALDVVNRALRAGHPVVSAVRLAGEEMGDPIGSELGLVVDETTYGFEFREALMNFARRSGSDDAHFFAVSVGIQAETGGNLAEILEGLAAVIRSRASLAKRVKALSSEGRASATLLSVLPVLMISFLLVTNPTYYTSKFSDPIFWPVASGVFASYLVGLVMIRRIINFKY
jgi:tight adherence protein B